MTKELLDDLLREVRRRFYAEAEPREFFAQRRQLIKALTWPAAWLRGHGFGSEVTPRAYRQLVLTVLGNIEEHGRRFVGGATSEVGGYFPTYLLKCLQDHCRHNTEAVLYDFKALRNRVDFTALIGALRPDPSAPASPNVVDMLAQAHELLRVQRRKPAGNSRDHAAADRQMAMF